MEDTITSLAPKGSAEHLVCNDAEIHNCVIKKRVNPQRRREKVYVGCGAGFGVAEWMLLLLPLAVERGVCIITNMGATNPFGAQEKVLEVARKLGFSITVGVAHQYAIDTAGLERHLRNVDGGSSVYLGAAPIVGCLEKYKPDVIITFRVADASLFLAPMIYELGWNWDELQLLAQGSLAGPPPRILMKKSMLCLRDKYREISLPDLLDLSLPFAEVSSDGKVCVAKADGSGGLLNFSTCAEQLLYEVGDPGAYVTPDVVIDIHDVSFLSLSNSEVLCAGAKPSATSVPEKLSLLAPKDLGWRGWGEISYGGYACVERAKAAEFLVRSWMEEIYPGLNNCVISYMMGLDSVKATSIDNSSRLPRAIEDIRLRMDGMFEQEEHAVQFTKEFTALYTNGPAGGGGISTGYKKEIILEKGLVGREHVHWRISANKNEIVNRNDQRECIKDGMQAYARLESQLSSVMVKRAYTSRREVLSPEVSISPAPSGQKISLYNVAHSRTGDKGNDLNFSLIPHFPTDISRLKLIITPQ
ncbi:hypothetical protein RJ639_039282 [Escallonia herrerae]|uniref:Uncharacterized protein n=1 Tax=Escallonia herrerae TaxID=1293975 RepID=A0AA88WKF1_9ASTE|nr:hypothetical protein RJ639_039282 [Escallonia herrerae]